MLAKSVAKLTVPRCAKQRDRCKISNSFLLSIDAPEGNNLCDQRIRKHFNLGCIGDRFEAVEQRCNFMICLSTQWFPWINLNYVTTFSAGNKSKQIES